RSSDRIIIMQTGRIVESGDARSVLDDPKHPYSILLKSSVLSPEAALAQGGPIRTSHPISERG
ncbi:MAG: transporter ATP-binding protein, partial [Rhizobiaceae bacterium]|nr:transporter ATP-binding protein [Rhizobiaceae bacterium]